MENIDPIVTFWVGLGFLLAFGVGLFTDIILVSVYWDKWRSVFRKKLSVVNWSFGDVLKICGGLVLIYLSMLLAGIVIKKYFPEIKGQYRQVLNAIVGLVIYICGIWYILAYAKKHFIAGVETLGIKWEKWRQKSFKAILFYFGFFPIFILLAYVGVVLCNILGLEPEHHPLIDILKKEKSMWVISYFTVLAALIAPVFEEVLFRGLFYQFLKKRLGCMRAALLSSCFFSVLHFNNVQFFPIMGLGMLLCFIFETSGSLMPAVAIHMFNNGLFLGVFFILRNYI